MSKLLEGYEKKDRATLLFLMETAESAERTDDVVHFLKLIIADDSNLSEKERDLMAIGLKTKITQLRHAWRALMRTDGLEGKQLTELKQYRSVIEQELKDACAEAQAILDLLLKNPAIIPKTRVFYMKSAGDYQRYLAEFDGTGEHAKKAQDLYSEAYKLAQTLDNTDPVRLGLVLNYSVCLFEILKNKKLALEIAKNAFDDAINRLDTLDEAYYKDSTLIMQLLRDNLTLWSTPRQK
eukprot:gb/GEZN01007627.1/.p1 GENE.gb/GEZN01007627.1/~~gb/GEZN01007627.1/.p1  ORF type:complete len:238 (-),score=49.13 gb/GEZN01007627.1/:773-1486(-)